MKNTLHLNLVAASWLCAAALSCGGDDPCSEKTNAIEFTEPSAVLGFSYEEAFLHISDLAVSVTWADAPPWVGLTAHGETTVQIALTAPSEDVREVLATRTLGPENDASFCQSRLMARHPLYIATTDGALNLSAVAEGTVSAQDRILFRTSLSDTTLVAKDVQLTLIETIEQGERQGLLVASREEPQGSKGTGLQVFTLATWHISQ